MSYKVFDFECKDCGHVFEELTKEGEVILCANCNSDNTERLLSAPNLNTMNLLSKADYAANMKARSAAHTAKDLKQNGMPLQNGKSWGGKI